MRSIIILLAALAATGCIRPQGIVTADVDPSGWGTPAKILFENADTLRTIDLSVVVRYDRAASGATLPLGVRTTTPDSLTVTEHLQIPLPVYGKGGCTEAAMLYRSGVVLSRSGAYDFEISPQRSLKGVHAVGLEFREEESR